MSRTLYNSVDEAIADYLVDCERNCRVPYKVSERLDWCDWIAANPPPSNKYVINWAETLRLNFDYNSDGWAIVWKPLWSQKWECSEIDCNLMNRSFNDEFDDKTEAVLFQVIEDDRASDTDSTATAPDAEEAPTEPLPRD